MSQSITSKTAKLSRRNFNQALALAPFLAALPSGFARAQSYPTKPIRFILPFGAGGVADATSRLVMEALGQKIGQPIIIENMPGAGGISAARAALQGGKDGYSLALFSNGTAISVPLFKSLPFDPVKEFVPVSSIGFFECLLTVSAGSPHKTLADFVKAAKEKPGTMNVCTIVAGSTQHLTAELFVSMAGLDVVHVPTKTSGDAVVSLMRGDVDMVVEFLPPLRAALDDKKIRALAWTGPKPSPARPDIPSASDTVPAFESVSWNAMYAPAGTPKEAIDVLNKGLQAVLAEEGLRKKALDLGITLNASTPEEIQKRLLADIEKWRGVIQKAKIPQR